MSIVNHIQMPWGFPNKYIFSLRVINRVERTTRFLKLLKAVSESAKVMSLVICSWDNMAKGISM